MGIPVGAAEFKPTGTVVHDDAVDWDGSFDNMTDEDDELELISTEVKAQHTHWTGRGAGWLCGQSFGLTNGEVITHIGRA